MYESITGGSWGKVYKNSLDFLLILNYQPVSKLKNYFEKNTACSMLFPSTAFLPIQKQNSYLFGIYGHI